MDARDIKKHRNEEFYLNIKSYKREIKKLKDQSWVHKWDQLSIWFKRTGGNERKRMLKSLDLRPIRAQNIALMVEFE